jgi:hypothetical protein
MEKTDPSTLIPKEKTGVSEISLIDRPEPFREGRDP